MPPGEPAIRVESFPLPGGGTVDVEARGGEVLLLTGPNGSGKTSLLRSMAGLDAARRPRSVRRSASVQLMTQDARDGLIGLTVDGEFRLRRLQTPSMGRLARQDVATLSSGEARRVALAVADAAQAGLLLLDEPAEGLDDAALAALLDAVRAASNAGTAVVAADHSGALARLATRRIPLGAQDDSPLAPIPLQPGPSVLVAPASPIRRGSVVLRLPGLDLGPGFHVLAGPNGSGKSTLLLRLAGLADAEGVHVTGRPPRPGATVRLLLPTARELFTEETVAAELEGCQGVAGLVPRSLSTRHPLTLSGGEAQRVALAATLGRHAPVYLLDEPDAHLDAAAWPALRDAIAARVAAGACVVAATHDARLRSLAHTELRLEVPT